MPINQRLPRSTPEVQGVPTAAIQEFLSTVEKEIHELHSFMLVRHGHVIAESWWSPYAADRPHVMYSVSKSFTSTAIGLAVAEGRLSVDDHVLKFFPDEAPKKPSPNLAEMRVRHLLSMSTGHADDTMDHLRARADGNWIKAFLKRPVTYAPGTHFLYNTGASYILSAILQKVTGQMLIDYLQPRLFEPLGIRGATWEVSPQGINTGGFGLNITTEDLACFGQLYLQKGHWNGQALVPEAWIAEATAFHSDNSANDSVDWRQGYGYQFWRCQHNAYRGDGAFGQFCVVMPEQDAVLAITAGVGPMQPVLDIVWAYLLPALNRPAALPPDDAYAALQQKLAGLEYLPPHGASASPIADQIAGKVYTMRPNASAIKSVSFRPSETGCAVAITTTNGEHRFTAGWSRWQEAVYPLFNLSPRAVASSRWLDDNTLEIVLRHYETPHVLTLVCRFAGDGLQIESELNVWFGPTTTRLKGKMQV